MSLLAMAAGALVGVVKSVGGAVAGDKAKEVWRLFLDLRKVPEADGLAQAIRHAELRALRHGMRAYERLPHPGWRDREGWSPEDITTPLDGWIKRALVLPPAAVETEEAAEAAFANAFNDPAVPNFRRVGEDRLLAEARAQVQSDADWSRFETIIREGAEDKSYLGWWPSFRAFLAKAIERDDKLFRLLAGRQLARLLDGQDDLRAALKSRQTDFEDALAVSQATWHGVRQYPGWSAPRDDRVRDRPTELLLAKHRIVPFRDRDRLLAELLGWATDASGHRAQGRLYTAGGGQGKTRLGIELLDELAWLGWRVTFLLNRNTADIAAGALPDLLSGKGAEGVCVVVDYAESQIKRLSELANAAGQAGEVGPPIRILAFARSAEGWWDGFVKDADIFSFRPFAALQRGVDAAEAHVLFADARAAFRSWFQRLSLPHTDRDEEPDLSSVDQPLLIVARAFLAAAGTEIGDLSVLEALFQEEQSYWRRALRVQIGDSLGGLDRAAAQVTLVQGATEAGTLALIRVGWPGAPTVAEEERLVAVLGRLYGFSVEYKIAETGQRREGTFIGPIEPDILGEHAVMTLLSKESQTFLFPTLSAALSGQPFFSSDASTILTVVTRATHPAHEPRIRSMVVVSIDRLSALVVQLSEQQLMRLSDALPRTSVVLAGFAVAVSSRLVELCYEDSAESNLPKLALGLNNLSNRFAEVGDRDRALETSYRSVLVYKKLLALDRVVFLPKMAMATNNLALRLSAVGKRADALIAARDAVGLKQELVLINPKIYLPELASSLNNLSGRLSDAGSISVAFLVSRRAVKIYLELIEHNRRAYLPRLTAVMNNLGDKLAKIGDFCGALAISRQAVELNEELVALSPDAFLPNLAASLVNLAQWLACLEEFEAALSASMKGVEHCRELVKWNPNGHIPRLVKALGGLGKIWFQVGEVNRAIEAFYEGAKLIGPIALTEPQAFDQLFDSLLYGLRDALEPPRDCRRLQLLRGWSNDEPDDEQVFS